MTSRAFNASYSGQSFSASASIADPPPQATAAPASAPMRGDRSGPLQKEERNTIRRWDSAETTRLNQDQWVNVQSRPINVDLQADRATLVARSRYERRNNPIVEGVFDALALDVVGEAVATRLLDIDPERMNTDPRYAGRRNVALGVERGTHGNPSLNARISN